MKSCRYCKGSTPATKQIVWADGRAAIYVCNTHVKTGKSKVSDVVAVRSYKEERQVSQAEQLIDTYLAEKDPELTKRLKKNGARDPEALAAAIGRKKHGKDKFQSMAAKGRK